MSKRNHTLQHTIGPWLVILTALITTTVLLRQQGRRWWCACGRPTVWAGNTKSAHNSQHVLDPYSLTHVLHGVGLASVAGWAAWRVPWLWRLALIVVAESAWEVVENGDAVIRRYRDVTLALGYEGDSVANSLGDIACCAAGVVLARRLGFRRSLGVFVATEATLVVWIRDSLVLNIVMLLHPIDRIKRWQMRQG